MQEEECEQGIATDRVASPCCRHAHESATKAVLASPRRVVEVRSAQHVERRHQSGQAPTQASKRFPCTRCGARHTKPYKSGIPNIQTRALNNPSLVHTQTARTRSCRPVSPQDKLAGPLNQYETKRRQGDKKGTTRGTARSRILRARTFPASKCSRAWENQAEVRRA